MVPQNCVLATAPSSSLMMMLRSVSSFEKYLELGIEPTTSQFFYCCPSMPTRLDLALFSRLNVCPLWFPRIAFDDNAKQQQANCEELRAAIDVGQKQYRPKAPNS